MKAPFLAPRYRKGAFMYLRQRYCQDVNKGAMVER